MGNAAPKVLDASTAHQVDPAWVYGFAKYCRARTNGSPRRGEQRTQNVTRAGAIGLLRPLLDAGIMPADYPVTANAVSGYSGGGKSMIQAHDTDHGPAFRTAWPEAGTQARAGTQLYGELTRRPIFVPSVGHLHQGHADFGDAVASRHADRTAKRRRSARVLQATLRWLQMQLRVVFRRRRMCKLEPDALNDTDRMELSRCTSTRCTAGVVLVAPAGQSRQGRVRRHGAEHRADAWLAERRHVSKRELAHA